MFRYSVGRWDTNQAIPRWVPYAYLPTPLLAVRTARRLWDKQFKAWLHQQGHFPDVDCVRLGGGTVMDLEYRFSPGGRHLYRRIPEQFRQNA